MYMFFIVVLIIISNSSRIYLILFYFTEVVFLPHLFNFIFLAIEYLKDQMQ